MSTDGQTDVVISVEANTTREGSMCNNVSLRDWLAGQAMIGMLVANGKRMIEDAAETEYHGLRYPDGSITGQAMGIAEDAYALSDAMLGVRATNDGRYPDPSCHGKEYALNAINQVRKDHWPDGCDMLGKEVEHGR